MLQVIGCPDLRNILDGCQDGGHYAQHIRPDSQVVSFEGGENAGDDNDGETMQDGQRRNQQSCLPVGLVFIPLSFEVADTPLVIGEEHQEQDEAVVASVSRGAFNNGH